MYIIFIFPYVWQSGWEEDGLEDGREVGEKGADVLLVPVREEQVGLIHHQQLHTLSQEVLLLEREGGEEEDGRRDHLDVSSTQRTDGDGIYNSKKSFMYTVYFPWIDNVIVWVTKHEEQFQDQETSQSIASWSLL